MKVTIAHPAKFPVIGYGGTERAIWWLAKGLAERGHEVTLAGLPGSRNPYGPVFESDFSGEWYRGLPVADIRHFFFTPPAPLLSEPYLLTIEGNAKAGEEFPENTVFVSRNHAERHGGEYFVYNGLDLSEYPFVPRDKNYWFFLAKASWRVKNVKGAIRIARKTRVPLHIIGGGSGYLPAWRGVKWRGMLGGSTKLHAIQGARGLLFPVVWNEPFGIAVIEALALGAPVVATPFGSLPELVPSGVGFIGKSYTELEEGVRVCEKIDPSACRAWAEKFSHAEMARAYEVLYQKVLSERRLHSRPLVVAEDQGRMVTLQD